MKLVNSEYTGPINIGNPREFTILELAQLIKLKINQTSNWSRKRLEDDPSQRKPIISLAEKNLNWKPSIELEEGLNKTIEYFKSNESRRLNTN